MNERIESLWKDATSYANEATSDLDVWHEIRRKKFAELIVQECVDICNLTTDRTYLNGVIAGDKIKKHFTNEHN